MAGPSPCSRTAVSNHARASAATRGGVGWPQTGIFDRLTIVQADTRHQPTVASYVMFKSLHASGAAGAKKISPFRLSPAIDPLWRAMWDANHAEIAVVVAMLSVQLGG